MTVFVMMTVFYLCHTLWLLKRYYFLKYELINIKCEVFSLQRLCRHIEDLPTKALFLQGLTEIKSIIDRNH